MPSVRGVFVGLATLDVVHHVQRAAGPNEKVTAQRQFVAAGGPAANAAVTFAALGGRAVLVTALGSGPVADLIRADLAAHDVTVLDLAPTVVDRAPVSSIVVQPSGERSIVSIDATGPDRQVDPKLSLRPNGIGVLDGAHVVLVDGHLAAAAVSAAHRATDRGIPVVVDAGRWKPVFADLVACNPEFVCSADLRAPGTDSVQASAAALRSLGVSVVVTTRGAEPVLWWQGTEHGREPVPSTVAVDTSGAGDAFHGGYAHARAGGDTVPASIRRGVSVASVKVGVAGPREWLRTLRSAPIP